MKYTFQYKGESERELLINQHSDKSLIEEMNIVDGNFLVFSNDPYHDTKRVFYVTVPQEEYEEVKLESLQLKLAIAESAEVQQRDKMENQIAVAELVETLQTRRFYNG